MAIVIGGVSCMSMARVKSIISVLGNASPTCCIPGRYQICLFRRHADHISEAKRIRAEGLELLQNSFYPVDCSPRYSETLNSLCTVTRLV